MQDCLIVSAAVIIGFLIGIMILMYPSGPAKWGLKKIALMYLRSPHKAHLSYGRLYPGARFTLLQWTEAMAKDPEQAIYKYAPWVTKVSFFIGTIWLLVTARVAFLLKPLCLPIVQGLWHHILH